MQSSVARSCQAGALLLFTASAGAAQTSPMFRGTPAHEGVSSAPLFQGQGGVIWRFHTGSAVRSSPAVTETRVFIGSGDGSLYALDRSDGTPVWRYQAGDPVTSSPAFARGLVIAATHRGRIFAVDAASGKLRWSRRTGPALPFHTYPAGAWDPWASSPVVSGSTVVIGGRDGLVYALDLGTGKTIWT